jgi:hypothetical protein
MYYLMNGKDYVNNIIYLNPLLVPPSGGIIEGKTKKGRKQNEIHD